MLSGTKMGNTKGAFLSDAVWLQMEIDPLSGPEIEALLAKAYNAPKDVVSAAAQLVP
jgi:hypothetical protein